MKYTTQSGTVARNATSGYYECAGSAVGRLSFPEKDLLKRVASNGTGVNTTGSGSVTFYSDNGVEDCRLNSISGTSVPLGSAYSFGGTQTFVFSGANIYIGGSDGYTSSFGKNFSGNLSKYKLKYSLDNSTIIDCSVKNQVLRHYVCSYTYNSTAAYNGVTRKNPLILNDWTPSNNSVMSTTNYYTPSVYTAGVDYSVDPFSQFKDTCIVLEGTARWGGN